MSSANLVSKHLLRRDIERDPDHINQMLWKRKIYKKRVARNETKRVRKNFFKEKEDKESVSTIAAAGVDDSGVTDKQREFYK